MIPLIRGIYSSQVHRNRKQDDGYQGTTTGGGNGRPVLDGYRASDLQDEQVLEVCFTTTCPYLRLLDCTLETVKW